MKLHALLFELSSNERMDILKELQKQKLKLSPISRKISIGVPEASRHLQRLTEVKLIEKDSNGYFKLSPYGTTVLSLLSGLRFASSNTQFFLDYDLSGIPDQFISRIGDWSNAEYSSENLKNLAEGEKRIREAQEYTWILSDQILSSSIPTLAEKIINLFDLRIILPEGKFPPESVSRLPSTNIAIQKRVLKKVPVLIVLTEKFAICCLPNQNGVIDYTGFSGEDAKFHQWCNDLFLYYWKQAKPFNQTNEVGLKQKMNPAISRVSVIG